MRICFLVLTLVFASCQTVKQAGAEASKSDSGLSEEVLKDMEKAEAGINTAQNRIGVDYLTGDRGLPEDLEKAHYWFNESASGGNRWAMSNLAKMYRDGYGVEQDYSVAKEWFLKSSELGNYQAMANLAEFYAVGNGMDVDLNKASKWYGKSLLGGFDPFIANNAAWFFSTVEDDSLLKPHLAINLMLRVVATREIYYELDTLAAAYAANGDFDNAIIAQQRALELGYENEVDQVEMDDFENRLGVYFDRQRYVFFKETGVDPR